MEKAKECGDRAMHSTALFELGKMMYYQGEKERAYKYLNEAITMMEETDYDLKYDNLRYYYNTIILYLLWDERLEESLEALDKLEAVVTSVTGGETHISGLEEKELKRLYANRAVALARLYRTEEADECYRKFLSLGDSRDNYLIIPYLFKRVPKNKFAQIFKENAGMSFTEYVNGMRMEYAASLLKNNPQFTIEAVAKEVGLSSAQFYKLFQKRFGITPSVFRNNLSNSGLVEK